MSDDPRARIAERLREAGVSTERFIQVQDGEKSSIDHERHGPDGVSGNYGIYALGKDPVVLLDVDDYGDLDDQSGISALHSLPPTLEQGSPHGGTHRIYRVDPTDDGRLVAAALKDAFDSKNPNPSWGEVRAANQYVVGAGSQLDGCEKEWCDSCADSDGGYYVIQEDRPIETITAEALVDALSEDPELSDSGADDGTTGSSATPAAPDDVDDRLEFARRTDDKLDRLMRGDYSDYRDASAGDGVDRSKAERALAYKLAFWLGDDRRTVRQVIEHDAKTKKWDEREDDSYRNFVLDAVDQQDEFYTPGPDDDPTYAPDVDWDEVDRGQAILEAERGITEPYGALAHQDGQYGYFFEESTGDGETTTRFVEVTNFTLELEHVIRTYEGKLLTLTVHPSSPMEEPYTVQVHPTVFNSPTTFSEEVVRGRTTYFNPVKNASQVLRDLRLTVGHQQAPRHVGTEYIGLHGDDYEEWVTPAGTLGPDGWQERPEHKYYEKGGSQEMESSLEDKWALDPDDGAEYDEGIVAAICRRVQHVRMPARGLPILGWFYAAPLKPLIHEVEGEFNLLQVTGTTETGKTSTLQLLYRLFGADPAPFGCGDTNFTIEKKFAGSCGLPIWLDEYKPADLSERKLNWLHRRLREVTRAKSVSKGQADLGEITFKMRAPVVYSGEQTVTEAAVRRRTVMTQLTDQATQGSYQRAFCELTGASYTDNDGEEHYPEGFDLRHHAVAYYRYLLETDPEQFRKLWQDARELTREHLSDLNVPDLEGSEFQGLQTVVFGIAVFKAFASRMGVDESGLPTESGVQDALAHVVSNIGPGGRRREHIDEFTELLAQAASAEYLTEGEHHRVYEPEMADGKALAFHMPTSFSAVKKYVQEYNLRDEYDLLGKNDYIDGLRDKAEAEASYPLAVNHRVRGIENGQKAVVIDPQRAAAVLPDGFNLSAFTEEHAEPSFADASSDDDDDGGAKGLADLRGDDGYVTVEAEAASVVDPKPWLEAEGTLSDGDAMVDFEARGDGAPSDFEQGRQYRISDAKVTTNDDGVLILELRDGVTEATALAGDEATQSGLDAHGEAAATDGGAETAESNGGPPQDAEGPQANAARLVTMAREEGPVGRVELLSMAGDRHDIPPDAAEAALEKAKRQGDLVAGEEGIEAT